MDTLGREVVKEEGEEEGKGGGKRRGMRRGRRRAALMQYRGTSLMRKRPFP